jgi:hypothetical protein
VYFARIIPNDLQQVAKAFLRDRASDGLTHSIRVASWDGDVYSIAAALDAGELVDDFRGYVLPRWSCLFRCSWQAQPTNHAAVFHILFQGS